MNMHETLTVKVDRDRKTHAKREIRGHKHKERVPGAESRVCS